MRVMIDGRPLQGSTGWRGVGRYVRGLVDGLAALPDAPEIALLVDPRRDAPVMPAAPVRAIPATAPAGPAMLWSWVLGPRWIGREAPGVWHATFLAPPRTPRGVPWVATIHDLIPLRHPQGFTFAQRVVFSRSLRRSARAPRVIAVSAFTARLVTATFGVPAGRIDVVPPPVDVARYANPVRRGLAGLDRPYVLHLGGFDPLKGVPDLLLPAFAAIARERPDLVLALTGGLGAGRTRAEAAVRARGLGTRVLFAGRLGDDDHAAAIAGAEAVVVSSREEGFGMPVVEALAAGVPVAVGPAEASREAAGPHGFLASDETPAALARAIAAALEAGPAGADARRAHAGGCDAAVVAAAVREAYRRAERGA